MSGLRRRGGGGDPVVEEKPVERVTKIVKKFDMYAKVKDEYRETAPSTAAGGGLTVFAWALTALLTLSEMWSYSTTNGTKEHMLVDNTLGQKLRINMNITFPGLSCAELHVDAMDVAGDYHPYMEQNMVKQRLNAVGKPLGRKVEEQANVFENKDFKLPENYCGSCYGAEERPGDCCNSCDALVARYSLKGWATKDIRRTSEQCMRDAKNPLAGVGSDEGCNLSGFMLVNKVAGNFHVALGESVVRDGRFIHQFQPQDAPGFNASHIMHHLSFGEPYPGMRANPMDGQARIFDREEKGTGLQQYFIKLVPTIYEAPSGETTWTNQYSYTERFRPLAEQVGGHHAQQHEDHNKHGSAKHQPVATTVLPGVFWVYDLSAFMVEISPVTVPFTHFLARLCAIAGGVFTLTGLLSSAYAKATKGGK